MKKLLLSFVLIIAATYTFAQSDKFINSIEKNITLLDSAKTSDEMMNVAATFERIADAEKTQWLPYYYAALGYIRKGFTDQQANKDEVATKAETLIGKAQALEAKNADLQVLKYMALTLHMIVDPQNRWMQYGNDMSQALATAKQLDPNNPRVYLMEGQGLFGTPPQFGGGKDKAKPVFEKSVALFQAEKPASSIHPRWGMQQAQLMLERCS